MAPIQSKAKLNKQTKTKPGAVLWFDWHRNLGAIYLVGAIAEFFCNDVKWNPDCMAFLAYVFKNVAV